MINDQEWEGLRRDTLYFISRLRNWPGCHKKTQAILKEALLMVDWAGHWREEEAKGERRIRVNTCNSWAALEEEKTGEAVGKLPKERLGYRDE